MTYSKKTTLSESSITFSSISLHASDPDYTSVYDFSLSYRVLSSDQSEKRIIVHDSHATVKKKETYKISSISEFVHSDVIMRDIRKILSLYSDISSTDKLMTEITVTTLSSFIYNNDQEAKDAKEKNNEIDSIIIVQAVPYFTTPSTPELGLDNRVGRWHSDDCVFTKGYIYLKRSVNDAKEKAIKEVYLDEMKLFNAHLDFHSHSLQSKGGKTDDMPSAIKGDAEDKARGHIIVAIPQLLSIAEKVEKTEKGNVAFYCVDEGKRSDTGTSSFSLYVDDLISSPLRRILVHYHP